MDIDIETLTLNEVSEIEELTGRAIDDLFPEGKPKSRVMHALYFIVARRSNPELTFEEAGLVTISEMSEALSPTEAAPA